VKGSFSALQFGERDQAQEYRRDGLTQEEGRNPREFTIEGGSKVKVIDDTGEVLAEYEFLSQSGLLKLNIGPGYPKYLTNGLPEGPLVGAKFRRWFLGPEKGR